MPARLMTSVVVFPCVTLSEVEAAVTVSDGAATTVNAMILLTVRPSPVAVTVKVAAPRFAAEVAVRVRVDEPAALLTVEELLLQAAVTPVGSPETLNVTAPVNVLLPAKVKTSVTVLP